MNDAGKRLAELGMGQTTEAFAARDIDLAWGRSGTFGA